MKSFLMTLMKKRAPSDMERLNNCKRRERGFSLLQLLITIAIISSVSVFALISFGQSRNYVRLQSSVRQLSSFLEKARLDSIRRHATTTAPTGGPLTSTTMASVIFTSTTNYNVTMDFDGTGNVATRSYQLDNGVFVSSLGLPSVTFNWRGRTSACTTNFTLQINGYQSWVDVSDAGDVTVNNDVGVLPTVSYTSVSSTGDVNSGTVVSGTGVHNNTVDCGANGGDAAVTDTTPITGTGTAGCKLSATPSFLSVKKNGGGTGTVTVSYTGTGTATVTPSGPVNLQITPTSRIIAGGGSGTFSIVSTNTTRSTFAVNFSSSCTTVTVAVKVTN